jgi:DNA-binding LacI/PurR family transcriptional regulator
VKTHSARKKSGAVTLAEVSADAGVSVMTVSNVVRGRHDLVRPDTRRRVEESIARLNYRPNLRARSLRLSENRSVGIVIADTDPAFLNDPFISRLVSGLSNHLSSLEFTLDVQGVSPERFESATILRKAGNDALCAILCGPKQLRRAHFDYLQQLGPPVIVFQELFRPSSSTLALVHQDDLKGGQLLARHLLGKGVKSAVFLRPMMDWCAIEQREKGARAVFAKASKPISVKTLVTASEGFEDVERQVRESLAVRVPDAIMAATDSMAAAALKACEAHGLRVPEDVLITGFNGFDVWRYTHPQLTTVISPAYEMGRLAGDLLLTRLKADKFAKTDHILPVVLQEGQSA